LLSLLLLGYFLPYYWMLVAAAGVMEVFFQPVSLLILDSRRGKRIAIKYGLRYTSLVLMPMGSLFWSAVDLCF